MFLVPGESYPSVCGNGGGICDAGSEPPAASMEILQQGRAAWGWGSGHYNGSLPTVLRLQVP